MKHASAGSQETIIAAAGIDTNVGTETIITAAGSIDKMAPAEGIGGA
jgi:hypothetical protein